MPVRQWLFKVTRENTRAASTAGSSKRELEAEEKEAKSNDLVVFNQGSSTRRRPRQFRCIEGDAEGEKTLTILLTRQDSKTCFYSTLNLKHLRNYYQNRSFPDTAEEEDHTKSGVADKVESAHVGCKVLPICSNGLLKSNCSASDSSEKDLNHGERRRAVSRMKELLRWAASSKSSKGNKGWQVTYFRSKGALKAPKDHLSSDSSKRSFSWDVGRYSTSSSAFSPLSLPSRNDPTWVTYLCDQALSTPISESNGRDTLVSSNAKECRSTGNWITTDADFVVLEL